MKIERTRHATKNIGAGMFLRLYQILTPFLIRTVMIRCMGEQYLGLNGLFTSVLHILNLAELGVGSAMVFSMYKPIAEDDEATVCALMGMYRRYYRLIGILIGAVGLLLTPVVPHLISGDVPAELNIYVLYWLNLGATVLTYWLFAYKNAVLLAHQRTDVSSLVSVVTTTMQYILQFAVMIIWKNYYLYVLSVLLTQALNNVITAAIADKLYPQYRPRGKLPKEKTRDINRRIRDLFTGKLGAVVLNSSDSVVISAYLGLSQLAIYQNYFYILKAILGLVEIVIQSIAAGLGNSYATESKEKNYNDMKKLAFLFLWIAGVCCCCFLGLYQPFMELWMGPELMLPGGMVILFTLYFYVYSYNRLLNTHKDAAGLWHEDRFRPMTKAAVNLVLNLLLVNYWGLYGILLSTIFALVVVGMPWLYRNLFTYAYPRAWLWGYLRQILGSTALTVAACLIVHFLCLPIRFNLWITLVLRAIICVIVPNVLFYIVLRRSEQFRPSVELLDRITKKKLQLEKRLFPE